MGWDTLFLAFFTLMSVTTVVVALVKGVTWGGGWEQFFTLQRRTNPFGFWAMTTGWAAMGIAGAFVLYSSLVAR